MMQTNTAARSAATGCGCGCGGSPRHVASAFVRPRFFAGQLLTEDDLQALTGYVTGKDRLRNRMLFGPGVVCGLEVACEPCGGGMVTVRPGYALDCCGNDIVVGCAEQIDVNALVRDLRIRSRGADCGDPCDDGERRYGLYVRYVEQGIEPIAPYATDDSCPDTGCSPSRIRETFTFVVKCFSDGGGHGYDPAKRLANRLGGRDRLDAVRADATRLGRYAQPALDAVSAAVRTVEFTQADAIRFDNGLGALREIPEEPSADQARALTERVRELASALARHDTYDVAGQSQLQERYGLDVSTARQALGRAAGVLERTVDTVWDDARDHAVARAILAEAQTRVTGSPDTSAALEKRMLAQGTPLSYALRAELGADLRRLRDWLLVRLETGGDLIDCTLRAYVTSTALPVPLPSTPPPNGVPVDPSELRLIGSAATRLTAALERYLGDVACGSILPPCGDCADTDVLLARLELDGCDVVRVCAADREQVLPGGPGYAVWASKLYEARALAERVCCQPLPPDVRAAGEPTEPDGPISLPYVAQLLGASGPAELDRLLDLLWPPPPTAPGDGKTAAELAELRRQVGALSALVTALQVQAGAPAPTEPAEPASPDEPAASDKPAQEPVRPAPAKKATPSKATGRRPRGSRSGSQEN